MYKLKANKQFGMLAMTWYYYTTCKPCKYNLLTRWHNTSVSTSTVTTLHIAITAEVVLTGVRTRHVADVSVVVINHKRLFNHGTHSSFRFLHITCILTDDVASITDARFTLSFEPFPNHVPIILRFAALNINTKTRIICQFSRSNTWFLDIIV